MKKLFCASLLAIIGLFFLTACQKEVIQSEVIKEIVLDTTIEAGSVFQLNLAPVYSSTKTASIIEQATGFKISEIDFAEDQANPVYHYSSNLPSGGTDKVTIAIANLPTNTGTVSKDSTIIYVNFTIK